jgi:hypothetical protein
MSGLRPDARGSGIAAPCHPRKPAETGRLTGSEPIGGPAAPVGGAYLRSVLIAAGWQPKTEICVTAVTLASICSQLRTFKAENY